MTVVSKLQQARKKDKEDKMQVLLRIRTGGLWKAFVSMTRSSTQFAAFGLVRAWFQTRFWRRRSVSCPSTSSRTFLATCKWPIGLVKRTTPGHFSMLRLPQLQERTCLLIPVELWRFDKLFEDIQYHHDWIHISHSRETLQTMRHVRIEI